VAFGGWREDESTSTSIKHRKLRAKGKLNMYKQDITILTKSKNATKLRKHWGRPHNLEVGGSNPLPATIFIKKSR
jgi:hypothetical protein